MGYEIPIEADSKMILRDYQITAKDRINEELADKKSTLLVLATGGGKTVVFGHCIKDTPGRALVLAHRKILINQAAQKIEMITGERCAVEMGDTWAAESANLFNEKTKTVVSTIQTQISGARGDGRMSRFDPMEFSLLIVDEAHRTISDSYKKVIEYYRRNPNLKVLGVTATPDRADEQALGQIYESVAFEYGIAEMVEDGWLVPIHQQRVFVDSLDFSKIRTTQGDLNGPELAAVMEQEANLHRIADPLFQLAGQKKTVIFATSVAHAKRLAEILNRHENGCAESVTADTPDIDRDRIFDAFKERKIRFLCNVGVLGEGYDEPTVEVVAMAKPTKSRCVYAQAVGRGTRPLPLTVDGLATVDERKAAIAKSDKPNLVVIDFVGNAGKHVLITPADILGGKFSDEAVERVKKERQNLDSLPADVLERLREAEIQIKKERDAAAEKRKVVVGKTEFRTANIDPFNVFGLTPAKPRGWDKPESEKQAALLAKFGITETLSAAQASQLITECLKRREKGQCTYKQARTLRRYGYDGEMSFEDAKRTMDALAANGWKPLSQPPQQTANVFTQGPSGFEDGCSDVPDENGAPF